MASMLINKVLLTHYSMAFKKPFWFRLVRVRFNSMYKFTGVQPFYYWSSTTGAGSMLYAVQVYLVTGEVFGEDKAFSLYVWPVRGGQ